MSRVLIAVTHLLGVGHFTRAAAIARALGRAGHEVTLVAGGRPAPLVDVAGARLVQLPPVHAEGTAFTTLRDETGAAAAPALFARRRDALIGALAESRPQVVITELFPFGRRVLEGEFMALVEAVHRLVPRPILVCSVRDILVPSAKTERVGRAQERLARFYDAILVHGDPRVAPLEASWPLALELRPLLHYTGYVHEPGPGRSDAASEGAGEIIVSAGGGGVGVVLFTAALGAAALMPERRWRVLVGSGLDAAIVARLTAEAPANGRVEPVRADFAALLAACAASVSQGGYNTLLDVMAARARAVVVPFEDDGETEQRARAERFAALGLLTLLPADRLTPQTLAAAVRDALARPRPEAARVATDGLAETVRLIEHFAACVGGFQAKDSARDRSGERRVSANRPVPTQLAEVLDELADQGRTIRFWWRDDDATAPSAALDRLLALARRCRVPLAIAAIPATAEPALAQRLAEEPLATVLVHGLSHANWAPDGEKKAEFGPHRPIDSLIADASLALALARPCLGARLLPVFVPPWNRVSAELVPALAALGYVGLSAGGPRTAREIAPSLIAVNIHLDPIDWRTRSLEPARLINRLRLRGRTGGDEPIGLLTHHLAQDEATWSFCEALVEELAAHPAVRMDAPPDLFGSSSRPAGGLGTGVREG